jgi:DNA-binding CsgD family transcriptional regulator
MTTHRSSALRTPPARERRTLLDLCSRLDLDDGAFLAEAASWWQRVCPAGPLGSIAVSMWRGGDGRVGIDPARHGSSEALAAHRAVFVAAGESVMTALIDTAPRFGRAGSIPDVDGALAISRGFGLCDFVGVLAPTGTGHLLVVGSPVERPAVVAAAPDPAAQACASHLAAAWRLRRRLQAGGARDDHAEAVALPDGRVVHAVGEAGAPGGLATIRRMVLARERARSGRRVDAEPLWPELVAGRWTLADSFDHDGRRYVVAFRNPPDAPRRTIPARAREVLARTARGEATKVIAADLGVSEAAVSMALHAAMAGLRIGSVGELVRLAAGADPETVFRDDGLWAAALVAPAGAALDALTGAEREVLDELLRGATNGQIAARRNRSARTVANQLASVFAKLGVDSRRGLLAKLAGR